MNIHALVLFTALALSVVSVAGLASIASRPDQAVDRSHKSNRSTFTPQTVDRTRKSGKYSPHSQVEHIMVPRPPGPSSCAHKIWESYPARQTFPGRCFA